MSAISTPLPTPPNRYETQLSGSVTNSALSFTVDDASADANIPAEGVGALFKKDADGNVVAGSVELIHWTGVSGGTISITDIDDRGLTGSDSGAQAYADNDYFACWVTSDYYKSLKSVFGSVTQVLDEDTMSSDSATALATQQSIKAYVDSQASNGGWTSYSAVIPTLGTDSDPEFTLVFAGVDLSSTLYAGQKVKFTQNAATVYGFITKVAFSTDTTVTFYGGTDYNIGNTTTYPITNFNYSISKAPTGFPLDPSKWTVETSDTTLRQQGTPTQNTWYNLGSVQISVPTGIWRMFYAVTGRDTSGGQMEISLSSANNSESEAKMTSNVSVTTADFHQHMTREGFYNLSSKTTHYLIARSLAASSTSIQFRNDQVPGIIRAVCAYL